MGDNLIAILRLEVSLLSHWVNSHDGKTEEAELHLLQGAAPLVVG